MRIADETRREQTANIRRITDHAKRPCQLIKQTGTCLSGYLYGLIVCMCVPMCFFTLLFPFLLFFLFFIYLFFFFQFSLIRRVSLLDRNGVSRLIQHLVCFNARSFLWKVPLYRRIIVARNTDHSNIKLFLLGRIHRYTDL